MVLLGLYMTAETENVDRVVPMQEQDWALTVRCTSCNEVNPAIVTVSADETSDISGSRGEANLVMRCKFCKREGSINIVPKSMTADNALDDGKAIVHLECRGIDVESWHARNGWKVYAADSKTTWLDADLSDDWFEVDEKTSNPVSISDVQTSVKRVSGK
ncbi:hypothetical protein H9P43_005969 [Blastocladiella emersonii ATCC 22665]|nr:hypothetical protein H9P43_005969 [Blastocladiella emersonii ATCC 22665]